MLAVVDTNHLSELDRSPEFAARFDARRRAAGIEVFTSIVTVQGDRPGLAGIAEPACEARGGGPAYARFPRGIEALRTWDILPYDDEAAAVFDTLRRQRPFDAAQGTRCALARWISRSPRFASPTKPPCSRET